MPKPTGSPQHVLVADCRQDNADRLMALVKQAGLAVRLVIATSMDAAQRQAENVYFDLVVLSIDGPPEWSFEAAMAAMLNAGHNPLVIADHCNDLVISRAYNAGAQGVVPSSASEALINAIRWGLSIAADRKALSLAETIMGEVSGREQTLLDSSRDPVAYLHEGMHVRANRAYLDFFGIADSSDIDGLSFLDLVDPSDVDRARACLKASSLDAASASTSIDLRLISTSQGVRNMRLGLSRAIYEEEVCLQINLYPVAEALQSPESSSPLQSTPHATPVAAPETIVKAPDPVEAWWVAVTQAFSADRVSGVLLAYADHPEDIFSSVPPRHRGYISNRLLESVQGVCVQQMAPPPAVEQSAAEQGAAEQGAVSAVFLAEQGAATVVDLGLGAYGIAFSCSDAEAGLALAHRLHESLGSIQVVLGDQAIKPGFFVSGVLVGAGMGWASAEEALATAERNLIKSKKGSGFAWFDPSSQDREEMRLRRLIAERVATACATEDGLVLHYRPMMPLNSQPIALYEAFVRMRGPTGELMYPREFMPVVNESGLSRHLDGWVARAASLAVGLKMQKKQSVKLIVTICSETLTVPAYASQFLATIGAQASSLVVQLPEPLVQAHMGHAKEFRAKLSRLGVDMAISMFGHSHASAALLAELSPEWVKLDKIWSGDEIRSPEKQRILRELVAAAHAAKARTIADFVMDSTSMSVLFSAGVQHASGDFLASPMESMDADFSV